MTIRFIVVVNGGCYDLSEAKKKFKTLKNADFLVGDYTRVFAQDIDEAHIIKNSLTEKDLEYQSDPIIHRRKELQSYKTYWHDENIFIFVDRGSEINTR